MKNKNIHILPTNNSSRLSIKDGILILHRQQWRKYTKNIYITNDEVIKEGDWYLKANTNLPTKRIHLGNNIYKEDKKIILTTDQDLIKDGVQAIDDEFLEWFVKNPSCEEVEVTEYLDGGFSYDYKIIISKEEPKKYKVIIVGDGLPKQETLEEELLQQIKFCLICKNDYQAIRLIEKYGFQKQEQMYSEEEVLNFTQTMIMQYKFGNTNIEQLDLLKETLQQFKHK